MVLGPIFVENAIDERRAILRDELAADGITSDAAAELLESTDEYTAEGVFWVDTGSPLAVPQSAGQAARDRQAH